MTYFTPLFTGCDPYQHPYFLVGRFVEEMEGDTVILLKWTASILMLQSPLPLQTFLVSDVATGGMEMC